MPPGVPAAHCVRAFFTLKRVNAPASTKILAFRLGLARVVPSAATPERTRANGGVMRILIVEDDAVSCKFLQHILQDIGECDTAKDGQQGIEAFERALASGKPYDLVCLDIMMPKVDGQQALKTMRALERASGLQADQEVPIVITTALDDERNISEAYYSGRATAYVPKPIERTLLFDLLKNLHIIA